MIAMAKKKKDKINYIDDGRPLADMYGIAGPRLGRRVGPSPRFRDVWKTYWNAVRMMFLPMLAVIGAICVIFGILALIFRFVL